uniref:B- and T-lymphocyte attenuator-like n=1 Tax=Scatophagus argus TaxID=75038 RepID=UPI001ED82904|nr:B- and T-lymphocyte attenuator-like [Scatophagus argus]
MRFKGCLTALHVSVLAALLLLLTLEADGEDSGCEMEIRVRRGTVYKAFAGEHFSINCMVDFCNNSPPTVSWHKREDSDPVDVSSGHFKTKWTNLSGSEGIFSLFFQGVLESDSGEYYCRGGGSVSHYINVTVYVKWEHTSSTPRTVTSDDVLPQTNNIQEVFWSYVHRLVGVIAFAIIVTTLYFVPKYVHGGICRTRRRQDTANLSGQTSHQDFSVIHIYENDQ